jgi:hypothetical protein
VRRRVEVFHQRGLGDFDAELRRIETGGLERCGDLGGEAALTVISALVAGY